MPLSAGARLGPYELVESIGAGGMGEVWKARDTRLERIVALKVSAEQFSDRFEREARAIAALNHPNICTLYDIGPDYLVMEYIEGPTLAERISAGAVPVEEALRIALQIAEALEAAHGKGVIHRDLKPANIKLTTDGQVKVLDFGLAAMAEAPVSADYSPATSPTLALSATRAGMILGTAGYMSPEQARGALVDKRADIWSFGVVLLEMLTGRSAFIGATVADTLASVLKSDPSWSTLPPGTPVLIRRLLRRTLQRDRRQRLQDIGDARLEIEESLGASPEIPAQPVAPRKWTWLPWVAACSLFVLAAWLAFERSRPGPSEPSVQSSLMPPERGEFNKTLGASGGGMAISPDGRTLGFVSAPDGRPMLWVRRLDSSSARPLAGTENAYSPFWSPDSHFLGFFADDKLKRIEIAGGPVQVICDAGVGRGGTWNREGAIVFATIGEGLQQVRAAGGQPTALTKLDAASGETGQYWPSFLPDGRRFIYLSRSVRDKGAIWTASINGSQNSGQRMLLKADSNGSYVPSTAAALWPAPPGWLLFLREAALVAQRFDAAKLKVEGEPIPVSEKVGYNSGLMVAGFSASENGVLVYTGQGSQPTRLVWASRDGKQSAITAEPGRYSMPRLSPDGGRLISMFRGQHGSSDIWQIDLSRGISSRFSFDSTHAIGPIWSPDGKQIVYSAGGGGGSSLRLKPASGAGTDETILESSRFLRMPFDWSRDGRYILYSQLTSSGGFDLWALDLAARKAVSVLQTRFNENHGQFSPDGRWVAYSSDESGHEEIYIRSFTGPSAKFQVSNNGGRQPRWRGDGKELYYLAPDMKIMAVTLKAEAGALEREAPRTLFEARWLAIIGAGYSYDVTRDGQRFICLARTEGDRTEPLTLVTNWQAGLRK